ncbi:Phosphatidylinositol 4-kinase stt4 [Cryptotrichosporon argae]
MASSSAASTSSAATRLFVGNLAPTVDEYALVQIFSKYGRIAKLDLMFHKTGPLKGKPRGYAFVEYASGEDASKALTKLHDRLLRGKKLVVTPANAAPAEDYTVHRGRRSTEAAKPTALSLLKSQKRPQSAAAQIAAMEAKLAAMAHRPHRSPTPPVELHAAGSSGRMATEPEPVEDPLGAEEARRAADELEREWQGDQLADSGGASGVKSPAGPDGLALPPPAADTGNEHAAPALPVSRVAARQAAFQRGLAGLPKKPAI